MATTSTPVRDVRHLGDFSVTPRMLVIVALALPIGVASAAMAWALLHLIGLITNGVFHHSVSTRLNAPGGGHAWWLVLFAPIVGGLIVGVLARYGSEKIRGHGMPEAIESILLGGSKVQPRVALLKPIASAITIGSGGPFGAEGPIIMTGGALGSLFAQFLRLTADERKTLLVAGAAAGMAATFNAPLSSLTLAVELLLFEWRPRSMVPVGAAIAVATVLRHHWIGPGAVFWSDAPIHLHDVDYLLCLLSGVISALLAVVATQLVYLSEDTFQRLPIHWMWWPAIGGVVIGISGLIVPQALGVGYDMIGAELRGTIGLHLVIGLLIFKTLIWSFSLGSGTSGGVLAPIFMIGGALGALEAHLFPTVGAGFWALIALAGVLGGVMRSPLTGIVFALELTQRWSAVLPLMIAAVTAFGISSILLKRSVLTEKIARRGFHLTREYDVDPLEIMFVSEVMTPSIPEVPPEDPEHDLTTHEDQILRVVAEQMAIHHITEIPVVDRLTRTRIVGTISLQQLLEARRRDHQEARERERVLRLPVRAP